MKPRYVLRLQTRGNPRSAPRAHGFVQRCAVDHGCMHQQLPGQKCTFRIDFKSSYHQRGEHVCATPRSFCARTNALLRTILAPSCASLPVSPPTFFLYHACRSHATSYYACIVGSTRRWQRVCVLERRSRPASNSASVTSSRIFPARSEPHRTVANQPFSHDNRARGWCRGCICRGTCAIHVDTGQQRCQETDR